MRNIFNLRQVRMRSVSGIKEKSEFYIPHFSAYAGSVPDGRLMRRVAQIGDRKIFGSVEFVRETAFALGDRFRSRSVAARAVGELGFATHGWRLAKGTENVVA